MTFAQLCFFEWAMKFPGSEKEGLALGLGTVHFGTRLSEQACWQLLDRFVAAGGVLVDTAAIYNDLVAGEIRRSERILGDWLAARGNRDAVYLATKGAHPPLPFQPSEAGVRVRPGCIAADIDGSLRTLRVDRIDLYFLHRDDPEFPVAPLIDALNRACRSGKIGAFAASNWTTERIAEANRYAATSGQRGFEANQMLWNCGSTGMTPRADSSLIRMDADMKRYHAKSELLATPYSALAQGYFQKLLAGGDGVSAPGIVNYDTAVNRHLAQRLRKLSETRECNLTAVCLGYLVSHEFPVAPLVSPSTSEQLADSLKAVQSGACRWSETELLAFESEGNFGS